MTAPRLAYQAGRRIHVDPEARIVTIQVPRHTDRIPFDRIGSKVALYEGLHAKRPGPYAKSLSAARKAAQMVEAHINTNSEGGRA